MYSVVCLLIPCTGLQECEQGGEVCMAATLGFAEAGLWKMHDLTLERLPLPGQDPCGSEGCKCTVWHCLKVTEFLTAAQLSATWIL